MFSYSHITFNDLSKNDLNKLNVGECLNDNIINYYLKLCCIKSDKVFAFNTYAFNSWQNKELAKSTDYITDNKLLINLERFDFLIIPIHNKLLHHWSLFIADTKKKIIYNFDSLY